MVRVANRSEGRQLLQPDGVKDHIEQILHEADHWKMPLLSSG